jgi:hypothetical protein
MPWIAHRRRGSKFGHHSFWFALVPPPLLPLALSTSSLCYPFVLISPSHFIPSHSFDPSETLTGTNGDTTGPRHGLLSSFLSLPSASMLTSGLPVCL